MLTKCQNNNKFTDYLAKNQLETNSSLFMKNFG